MEGIHMDYKKEIVEMLNQLDTRKLKIVWAFIHGLMKPKS